jgi:hypothetical protein
MRALAAAIAVGAMFAVAAPAQAHPTQDCGDYGGGADYGPVDGAGIFNVTTRFVTCETALKIVKRHYNGRRISMRCNSDYTRCRTRVGTFSCLSRTTAYEASDTRCRSSRSRHYVVRWQFGA